MAETILGYSKWDKNLDYEAERSRLEELIRVTRDRRDKTFYAVSFIHLCNGGRISESLDCALQWARTGKREQRVLVRKRKPAYERLMIVPSILAKYPQVKKQLLANNESYTDLIGSIKKFMANRLGWNSHSARYAFIGRMSNELHPQALAKLTGHKTLDLILHYTQGRVAEAKLREMIP